MNDPCLEFNMCVFSALGFVLMLSLLIVFGVFWVFFRRGPSGPRFGPRNDKIKHVQNQVDEVIDVMQENITKVIERGERLDELQDKSESLSDNATAFSNRSKQLRRQMWWRGCKSLLPYDPEPICLISEAWQGQAWLYLDKRNKK
uniref:V-SNARE coiled-coil homology domain-containing protein n=1 Tax=Capra hircus TaxID=9925 RepID=A0A8C2RHI6_CAPHI